MLDWSKYQRFHHHRVIDAQPCGLGAIADEKHDAFVFHSVGNESDQIERAFLVFSGDKSLLVNIAESLLFKSFLVDGF